MKGPFYIFLITAIPTLLNIGCGNNAEKREDSVALGKEKLTLSPARKAEILSFWQKYRRATGLRVRGEWEEAVAAYQEALKLNPKHEDALYYLGNVLFESRQFDAALASWHSLLQVNDRSTRAHTQLGMIYSCGTPGTPFNLDKAEDAFKKALAINREESGPLIRLGEIYLLKGAHAQALEYLRAGTRTNFRSVEAHYLVGYLNWLEGNGNTALVLLTKAVDLALGGPKPTSPVLGEGATKEQGGKPLLVKGAVPRSLLKPFSNALQTWDFPQISIGQMASEYRRLDQFLKGRLPPTQDPSSFH